MIYVDEDNVGHETFGVRAADCDRFNDAGIPFFFSATQEMGGSHAAAKGLSIETLRAEKNWTWVITRNRIRFYNIPHWNSEVKLETWTHEGYRLNCPRIIKGYVKDELCFEAITHWVLLDLGRKRPIRPSDIVGMLPPPEAEERKWDPALDKLPKWEEVEKIELLERYSPIPHYYDVDLNKHINNVVYIRWIMESLSDNFIDTHSPRLFDVQWISQSYESDRLYVETAIMDNEDGKIRMIHRIMRQEEQKEDSAVFEAVTEWISK